MIIKYVMIVKILPFSLHLLSSQSNSHSPLHQSSVNIHCEQLGAVLTFPQETFPRKIDNEIKDNQTEN